jgi:hypothetical protein
MHHDAFAVGADHQQPLFVLRRIGQRGQRSVIERLRILAQVHTQFFGLTFAQVTSADPIQMGQGLIERSLHDRRAQCFAQAMRVFVRWQVQRRVE